MFFIFGCILLLLSSTFLVGSGEELAEHIYCLLVLHFFPGSFLDLDMALVIVS